MINNINIYKEIQKYFSDYYKNYNTIIMIKSKLQHTEAKKYDNYILEFIDDDYLELSFKIIYNKKYES